VLQLKVKQLAKASYAETRAGAARVSHDARQVESPARHGVVSTHTMIAAQFASVKQVSQQLCCTQLWQDAFVVTIWP
jgi:hypothetical protein